MTKPYKDNFYYLASPYSSAIPYGKTKAEVCEERHHEVQKLGLQLMKEGYVCWEPIAASYYKAITFGVPQEYSFWQARDRAMISNSDGVIVCNMDGWKASTGVLDEIAYARHLGLPVYLYHENGQFDELYPAVYSPSYLEMARAEIVRSNKEADDRIFGEDNG